MAGNKGIVKLISAQIGPLKEALDRIEKQQARMTVKQEKAAKKAKTQRKDENADLKKNIKDLELRNKQEAANIRQKELAGRKRRHEEREARDAQRKQDQEAKKKQAEEKKHLKDVNAEMKRGPMGKFANFLGRTAMFAAGGMAGLVVGAALRGYQNYSAYNQALGPSIGLGGRASREASGSGRGRGSNLGFNVMERAQLMPIMGRSTGVISPRGMMEAMRSTGMEAGEVGNIFGAIRSGGTKFSGAADVFERGKERTVNQKGEGKKEFAKIIAAGMFYGLEKARLPEFFEGITSLMRTQEQMSTGRVGSGDFAKLAAVFGRSGQAGMQGSRGMGVMAKLQQGILSPGGGENGMAFIRQAMGFGRPGSGVSFYSAEKQREKGLTSENFDKIMSELTRQYGSGEDAALKLRETFGVSLEQAESLMKIHESGDSMDKKLGEVDKVMEQSKSLEQRAVDEMKKANTNLVHQAGLFDQSVKTGARAAEVIEKLEKAQLEFTNWLMTQIPMIVQALRDILTVLKNFASALWDAIEGIPGVDLGKKPEWLVTTEEKQKKEMDAIFGPKKGIREETIEALTNKILAGGAEEKSVLEAQNQLRKDEAEEATGTSYKGVGWARKYLVRPAGIIHGRPDVGALQPGESEAGNQLRMIEEARRRAANQRRNESNSGQSLPFGAAASPIEPSPEPVSVRGEITINNGPGDISQSTTVSQPGRADSSGRAP